MTTSVSRTLRMLCIKKSLKIGVIRICNRRRANNTMTKRKWTKGQTTIYKTLHSKLKIEQRKPH